MICVGTSSQVQFLRIFCRSLGMGRWCWGYLIFLHNSFCFLILISLGHFLLYFSLSLPFTYNYFCVPNTRKKYTYILVHLYVRKILGVSHLFFQYQFFKKKTVFYLNIWICYSQNLANYCFRDLSYNDLTGPLPEFLAQLPNLYTL